MASKLDDLVARLRLDSSDFDRRLKGVQVQMGRVEKQAVSTGRSFRGMFGGAAALAAGAGLAKLIAGGVSEFREMEVAAAQTGAVLRSTGGVAGVTASKVQELASSIQAATGLQDDQVVSAQNLLLTFNKISGTDGTFERATRAALDLSVAFGTDAKSSAIQLGKALQDPMKGLVALGRVGVQFSAQQKEQIRAMTEAGDVAGAQRIILAELESQVGGSAEAFGNTLSGKIEKSKRKLEDFQEALAGQIIPFLANSAIPTIERFGGALADLADSGVGKFLGDIFSVFDKSSEMGKDFRKGMTWLTTPLGMEDRDAHLAKRYAGINQDARGRGAAAGSLDAIKRGTEISVGSTRRVTDAIEEATEATEKQEDASKRLAKTQEDLARAHRRVEDAVFDLADAEDDLREAQHREGVGSEAAIKAGRDVGRARLRVADAQAGVADTVRAVSEANKVAAESISTGLSRVSDAVNNFAKAVGVPLEKLTGLQGDFGNISAGAPVYNIGPVHASNPLEAVAVMNRELDWNDRGRRIAVRTQ